MGTQGGVTSLRYSWFLRMGPAEMWVILLVALLMRTAQLMYSGCLMCTRAMYSWWRSPFWMSYGTGFPLMCTCSFRISRPTSHAAVRKAALVVLTCLHAVALQQQEDPPCVYDLGGPGFMVEVRSQSYVFASFCDKRMCRSRPPDVCRMAAASAL